MDDAKVIRTAAIVAAAGRGARMGSFPPKQFTEIGGQSLLVHGLRVFQRSADVDVIVLTVPERMEHLAERLVRENSLTKVCAIVRGGERRQDSVRNALAELAAYMPRFVLVHDGVRPFFDESTVHAIVGALAQVDAVVTAVPAIDTVKLSDGHETVERTLDRDRVWLVQTPQGFRYDLLRQAYDRALQDGFMGTDDSSLVERLGVAVKILRGSYDNIKITSQEDLDLARVIFERRLKAR